MNAKPTLDTALELLTDMNDQEGTLAPDLLVTGMIKSELAGKIARRLAVDTAFQSLDPPAQTAAIRAEIENLLRNREGPPLLD